MAKLHLTHDEMTHEWRLRAFPDTALSGATVTRHDGIDLEGYLSARMRAWYVDLLHNAPPELLAPVEISAEIDITALPDGSAELLLPPEAVRLTRLIMPGWRGPAHIVTDPSSPTASLLLSGRLRPSLSAPIALVNGSTVRVFSPTPGSPLKAVEAWAVVDTPNLYHLDELALATIQRLY